MNSSITQAPGAFRPNDAARYCGFSRDTLDRLIAAGALRSYTVGRARFISTKELERFIADREANDGGAV